MRETAARFDETIDVDRFLPPKPAPMPTAPAMPGLGSPLPPIPGNEPAMPMPGGPALAAPPVLQ